jgi:hypothetical protein
MAITVSMLIVAGFTRTYLVGGLVTSPAVPAVLHVHGAVFAGWLILFVTQATLVSRQSYAMHQRLGIAAVIFTFLMMVLGVATAITVARRGDQGTPDADFGSWQAFLLLNLMTLFLFESLVFAAWYFRKSPQAHKRLMLVATIGGLAAPGIGRLPFIHGHPERVAMALFALLLVGPIYDLVTRRRVHMAYVGGVLASLTFGPPLVAALAATEAWRGIAAAMIR